MIGIMRVMMMMMMKLPREADEEDREDQINRTGSQRRRPVKICILSLLGDKNRGLQGIEM